MIKSHLVNMDPIDDLRPVNTYTDKAAAFEEFRVNTYTEWVCEQATDEQIEAGVREFYEELVAMLLATTNKPDA